MTRTLLVVAFVLAFVGAGAALYHVVFSAEEARPTWTLSSYSGDVQVQAGGGAWEPAQLHAKLGDTDRVRTGADGECTLVRDDSQVTVRARTELTVSQLVDEASRFQMSAGQVFVEARGDGISVSTGTGARVDARDAGLGMTVREDGWTQVKVKRGSADFTSSSQLQHVNAGEEVHAEAGAPPSRPVPIPGSILSNVRFPDADTFNSRLARIEGRADPGARVTIAGQEVAVRADGSFEADVTLEEGLNQIEVEATDAIGTSQVERSQPIRVDVTAPGLVGAAFGGRTAGATP